MTSPQRKAPLAPTAPVGEALSLPLADGIERNVEWGQLPAATPWLPPGGEPRTQKLLVNTIQRTALLRKLREAKSLPYSVESLHP